MNRLLFIAALTLLSAFLFSALFLPGFGSFENKVSKYHTENALEDTDAPNVVATIVWDYRAYDTLGEETVLFTATLGIYALFRRYRKPRKKMEILKALPKIIAVKKEVAK